MIGYICQLLWFFPFKRNGERGGNWNLSTASLAEHTSGHVLDENIFPHLFNQSLRGILISQICVKAEAFYSTQEISAAHDPLGQFVQPFLDVSRHGAVHQILRNCMGLDDNRCCGLISRWEHESNSCSSKKHNYSRDDKVKFSPLNDIKIMLNMYVIFHYS